MKPTYTKIILATILFAFFNMQSSAQKDTTEFEIGKKKLIVVDKKIQKENAIYNLEKGKETFEKEIIEANKKIAQQEKLLKTAEKRLQIIKDSMAINASIRESSTRNTYIFKISPKDTTNRKIGADMGQGFHKQKKLTADQQKKFFEQQKIILEQQKYEFEKEKAKIASLKATIEINKKKKQAFKSGVEEINKGIKEIENGLVDIDEELKNISSNKGKYKTSFDEKNRKKRFNAHWSGFEFGLLNFVNKNQSFVSEEEISFMQIVPEKTFSYGLNIFELNIPFTKYSFGLATGAGLRWSSISLEQNINLVQNEDGVIVGEIISAEKEIKKNKLNIAYIRVPVVLEYQKPIKSRKLYFSLGLYGELRGWSKQRQKYVVNEITYKDKKVDNFQLSPFTYGISARAGYGDIGLFVEYTLVPLFKDEKGPEMYPVMIGVRLVDF